MGDSFAQNSNSFWFAYGSSVDERDKFLSENHGGGVSTSSLFGQTQEFRNLMAGTSGGGSSTFGETQWYRDIMAQFGGDPGYFKDIDFSQFGGGIKIISRKEWGAKDPIKKGRSWESLPISLSAYYDTITIHHSGNKDNYVNIKQLQIDEQVKGYADIPYHFAIDSQGNIYEGRPIYIKGAHTAGANTSNIGIVLMSDLDYQNKGLSFEKFLYENYIGGNGGASTKMRESLTNLVSYLKYPIWDSISWRAHRKNK
ncbi:N-acetylmuramoyl-L-alanine amidase [Flavobacterium sp. B17]|uniref:N-acetylmuramoyl-L-alanine amidase n=1 Tax=Flavobacterium sp. B17 TaxID=95618 RepID=UPI0011D1CBFA